MAAQNGLDFEGEFNNAIDGLYKNNTTRDISPTDLRALPTAIRESYVNRIDDIIDEDDMVSNSNTKVPTQQSVKAYVDASAGGGGHTIEEEGTPLTQRTKLNFVGAGVTVTDDSGDDATVVTISSGGASDWGDLGGTLSDQTDLQAALDAKAPLASPTFTGTPAAPTASQGDNDTSIATTAFVNAEIAADAARGLAVVAATGAVISFAVPQYYGSASAITGNITFSTTGAVLGMEQVMRHNSATEPTVPSEFKVLQGSRTYVPSTDNYLYCKYLSATKIHFTWNQEQ